MTSETNCSPHRRPHGFDNGQYTQSLHPSRGDLRHALEEDKLEFLTADQNFWIKILRTDSVDKTTVDAIRQEIKNEVGILCNLAKGKNPLESKMYPPLTKIFSSIKRLTPKTTGIQRYWKDHHTQYPGVDSGVYISGLEGKEKPVVEKDTMDDRMAAQEGPPTKRVRTNKQKPKYKDEDSDAEDVKPSGQKDDAYRPSGGQNSSGHLGSNTPDKQPIFDARKPDWILLDGDSDGQIPDIPLWRQISVILELKGQSSLAPDEQKSSSSLIVQCVDYARLHLALRPFQRFSIIFSLCGTMFTAWLLDRTGVIISENVDIKKEPGLDTFIRAIIQVTLNLTMYDLGMDPTVSIHGEGSTGDSIIPRFAVTMPSEKVYITQGIPIWQSASIFGRGTVVWNVEEPVATTDEASTSDGNVPPSNRAKSSLILKNSYRNEDRIGESNFYLAIKDAAVEGLAIFREGGDVKMPEEATSNRIGAHIPEGPKVPGTSASKIVTANMDGNVPTSDAKLPTNNKDKLVCNGLHRTGLTESSKPDAIAHRLVLESRGQRLTEHGCLVDLLEALLASVKGHESLYNLGILHRDISIGNVFMSQSPKGTQGPPGFLADLDMAKVHDKHKLSEVIGEERALALVKATSSGSVTGTAQFMSLSLLRQHALAKERKNALARNVRSIPTLVPWNAEKSNKVATPVDGRLKDDPKNDLESFIWVLLYALCVKEMNSQKIPQSKEEYYSSYFNPIFGAISFEDTHKAHTWAAESITDTDESAILWRENRLSDGNSWIVLDSLVQSARDNVLDHKMFKDILEYYIRGLTQNPVSDGPSSSTPPEPNNNLDEENGSDNATLQPNGFDNGQYSHSLHPSRGDLRHILEGDKLVFLTKPQDFWVKFLLTDKVPIHDVDDIREAIVKDVDALTKLEKSSKPAESKMYAPLTNIFKSIRRLTTRNQCINRHWKDHHTQYPGVDSGVLISGLEGKADHEEVDPSVMEDDVPGSAAKRRRTDTAAYKAVKDDPEDEHQPDEKDSSYQPGGRSESQRTFDARKPDWILLDSDSGGNIPETPLWRQIAVVLELKSQSSYAPSNTRPQSSLIVQCVDYARLHLALRSFQRFSILFTLCGTLFNAWLIDRVGVVISHTVDIKTKSGLDIFISALVQVSSRLTTYELGMDPTIAIHADGAMGDSIIPRFEVTMPSARVYITKGIPIWQSSSIFGRGTAVWNVDEDSTASALVDEASTSENDVQSTQSVDNNTISTFILKTAYRNEERFGESEFYKAIKTAGVQGLAVFREGGDVYFSQPDVGGTRAEADMEDEGKQETGASKKELRQLVAISMHRAKIPWSYNGDSIAHRLVLQSKGLRLNEHGSLFQLLEAVLACVKGHESLYNIGILHRDISIGNVFISEKLAKAIGEEKAKALWKSTTSGSITGTAQFMALSLLEQHATIIETKRSREVKLSLASKLAALDTDPATSSPTTRTPDDPRDDLESFIWVIFYALCVKEMNAQASTRSKNGKKWYSDNHFVPIFGAISFEDTYRAHRRAAEIILRRDELANTWKMSRVPQPDAWIILRLLMRSAQDQTLDHTNFKQILSDAIKLLKPDSPAPTNE